MWCDCKIGKMWKNSTLSNPLSHAPKSHLINLGKGDPCGCHFGHVGRGCDFPNMGEMESVTCHLCTSQNQKGPRTTNPFNNPHFPCVDPHVQD